ncbi:GTP-binding protein [Pseudonocardia phyllosphaerae]|uniref:GTP-binding protein n=1 Tax=Pseudonocardia phyllosphaerae TaxID=3390502 RepID=UPI00397C0F5F
MTRLTIVTALTASSSALAVRDLCAATGAASLSYRRTGQGLDRIGRGGIGPGGGAVESLTTGTGGIAEVVRADLAELFDDPWTGCEAGGVPVVVALPTGMDADLVLDLVAERAGRTGGAGGADAADRVDGDGHASGVEVESVVAAVELDGLEDRLWSPVTMADAGLATVPGDERTVGEFVVGALNWCDTYVVRAGARPVRRGLSLLEHLAPRARATSSDAAAGLPKPEPGRYDRREVRSRTRPGAVVVPVRDDSGGVYRTVVCRAERPLHPTRLAERIGAIAAGCVWSRGVLWVASVPQWRVAWAGVGPEVGFEPAGTWLADGGDGGGDGGDSGEAPLESLLALGSPHGDRGTVLALTGDEVDAAEVAELLADCELDDDELALGADGWAALPDPFALRTTLAAV